MQGNSEFCLARIRTILANYTYASEAVLAIEGIIAESGDQVGAEHVKLVAETGRKDSHNRVYMGKHTAIKPTRRDLVSILKQFVGAD